MTTYFIGNYYEKTGSTITKYYYSGGQRVAMRKYTIPQSMTVEYLLGDHLGSTSLTTDADGAKVSEMRYKPWGEIRYSWTAGPTTTPAYTLPQFTFTGQRSYLDDPSTSGVEGFGLMDYNARWYDPSLGRFAQADSIVPGGVQGLDRYAYVNNAPTRFTDPSGHRVSCDVDENCKQSQRLSHFTGARFWKALIKDDFGITMSEKSDPNNPSPKTWNEQNLLVIYNALEKINMSLNGALKSLVGGATFKWGEHRRTGDNDSSTYHGLTYGTTITFYTLGNNSIRAMNIYHEFGHLLDNSPGMIDVFSTNPNINSPNFITDTGYLNTNAFISTSNDALQHPYSILDDPTIGAQEHWADIFANYVAGNIDLSKPNSPGIAMYNFVTSALAPYIGVP